MLKEQMTCTVYGAEIGRGISQIKTAHLMNALRIQLILSEKQHFICLTHFSLPCDAKKSPKLSKRRKLVLLLACRHTFLILLQTEDALNK